MSLFFGYTACLAVSLATLCVLTKDQTRAPSVKVLSPNHWITREFRNNSFFFFFKKHLWLRWVSVAAFSSCSKQGLLTAVASLVAEHGL